MCPSSYEQRQVVPVVTAPRRSTPPVETAKLNSVDPQAWLTDGLGRIAEHKITKLEELMPWRYAEASA